MGTPATGNHKPLTNGRQRDGTHNRHHLAAAHIQTQNRIAIFIILIYHGADCALEDLHFLFHLPAPFYALVSFSFILQHLEKKEKGKFHTDCKVYRNLKNNYTCFQIKQPQHMVLIKNL
jgi:hypothetical protein